MVKKVNYKLIILMAILFVVIFPNFSNAAKVSVGQVKNVKATSNKTTEIKISWKKVKKITGYRVYVYNNSTKKYEYYAKTKNTSITIKKLKSSTQYKIKVRAYKTVKGKNYYGKYSSVLKTATKPSETKNVKVKSQTDSTIKLSWSKVSRASGYRVYICNDSENKYKYYGYTNTNSITIKKLKSATQYKIKVRAYKNVDGTRYFGAYAPVVTTVTKPSKQTGVKMTKNTTSSITVSWNKLSNVSEYRVYICDNSKNEYKYYGQVKGTSIEIKELNPATTYKIKVRGFIRFNNSKIYGSYSDILEVGTIPQKVTNLISTNQTENSITLKWDKLNNITGYGVYIWSDLNGGEYREYKKTSSNTYTLEDLDAAKFYRVCIKAYKKINGKNYYGESSNIISVKTLSTEKIRAGIDVSKWQKDVDWQTMKNSGIEFTMIRAGYRGTTEGKIFEDDYLKTNLEKSTQLGLDVGVYFFSYAKNEEEAIEEAKWVCDKLEEYNMKDKCKYIVYDFEAYNLNRLEGISKEQIDKNAIAFLSYVFEQNYTPVLYGNKNYLTNIFDTEKIVSNVQNCKVWLAQYNDEVTYEGKYDIWQYTEKGKIDGISGYIDLNIIYF